MKTLQTSSFLWLLSTCMTLSVYQTAEALANMGPNKSLKLHLTLQLETPNPLLGTFIK